MAKKKSEVVVSFADSHSTKQVTGSCVLVNKNILLECGGSQGGSVRKTYQENNASFGFKAKEIEYVFLLHSHQDHIMRTPKIFALGGRPKVFIPSGIREIMYLSLTNCAMLLKSEAEMLSDDKKHVSPVFVQEDVDIMFENVYEVDMHINKRLDDNTSFEFISSGHVPFASSIILNINGRIIYYTSDLGSKMFKNHYVEDKEVYTKGVDLFITESTYADQKRSCKREDERDRDIERIRSVIEQYDKILIPSFAFARSQNILTMLYELYKDDQSFEHEIVLDSILLNDITDIYKKKFPLFRKVMAWDKVKQITKKERMALMQNKTKKTIVISASGSLVGGASVAWTKSFLPLRNSCCIIVGHTFEGTLGRKIKDGKQKTIKIGEDTIKNNMQVVSLKSMSSHIQYNELVDIITNQVKTPKVVLHHSNQKDKLEFKKNLDEIFSKKCKSVKVVCPDKKTKIRL